MLISYHPIEAPKDMGGILHRSPQGFRIIGVLCPAAMDSGLRRNDGYEIRMGVGSLFSGILGCDLPGEGTIYMGQTLSFKAPVPLNEKVTATVELTNLREDKAYSHVQNHLRPQQG